MGLFKNKIGRPSNSCLKKRKLIYIVIFLIIVGIICVAGLFTINYFKAKSIDALAKNAISVKVTNKIYSSKPQATVTTKNKATVINGCPKDYVHYGTNTCVKKTKPIKQGISFSLIYILENNESWNKAAPSKKTIETFAEINCNNNGYRYAKNVKYSFNSKVWQKREYNVTATCSDLTSKYYKSSTKITVPYYTQTDYSSTPSACGGGNLSAKGCLPTSGAMIFSALTSKKITPIKMNEYASELLGNCKYSCSIETKKNAYKSICSESSYYVDFLKVYANNNNMEYQEVSGSSMSSSVETYLKTGKCVGVAPLKKNGCVGTASKAGICSSVGHFVVFAASQKNDYVTVKDPLYSSKSNVEVKTMDLINSTQSKKVVLFCNKNVLKSPSPDVSSKTKVK